MKKFTTMLPLVVLLIFGQNAFGQAPTPLYMGQRFSNVLTTIDTTGGGWATVATVSMTSGAGSVNGVYGLSLNPETEEMYVLYQNASAMNRRLGRLNPLTGSITDIGISNNMNDITFADDATLYAMQGSWDGTYDIHNINTVTGVNSFQYNLIMASGGWGAHGITYDPFNDNFLATGFNGLYRFDPVGGSETYVGSGIGSETQAMVVVSPTRAIAVNYGNRYSINTVTGGATFLGPAGGNVHALAFGKVPCEDLDITVTTTELCEGDNVTLTAVSATGGTLAWDGGVVNGVPFAPGVPGVYTYNVTSDSEDDCDADPVTITVIGLPTVLAGAGDLIFCEDQSITLSAGGDADLYEWNDGAPLDLTPGVGTYTFDLTGYYTEGGCLGENYDEVTVEVVALPTITATASDTPICLNNEVTFNGGGGVEYEWDNDVINGVAYTPASTGTVTYTVYGTDENGCSNMASVDVEVVPAVSITAVATDEIVGGDATLDITISGGAPAYTFDWDNDGTGDFDDTEDLTGLTAGEYTVVVQSEAGCSTTATYRVDSQLSIGELDGASIAVYPNPTQDNITILSTGNFNFEVVAINGEVLFSGSATDTKNISLIDFADGVYFVNVTTSATTSTIKVVKK